MPPEIREVQAETVLAPERESERRVDSINTVVGSMKSGGILQFFKNLFGSFFGKNNRQEATARAPVPTPNQLKGGMTQAEYLAAIERADNADAATLATMMTDQVNIATARRDAGRARTSNMSLDEIFKVAGNILPGIASRDRIAETKLSLAGQAFADGEPEAMRSYLYVRNIVKQAGLTLVPGNKQTDLLHVQSLQRNYQGMPAARRPATYAEYLTNALSDIGTRAKDGKVTMEDIRAHVGLKTYRNADEWRENFMNRPTNF